MTAFGIYRGLLWALWALLFVFVFCCIFYATGSWLSTQSRHKLRRKPAKMRRTGAVPRIVLKLLWIRPHHEQMEAKLQQLRDCGWIDADIAWYEALRRVFLFMTLLLLFFCVRSGKDFSSNPVIWLICCGLCLLTAGLLLLDRWFLSTLGRQRKARIVEEIYIMSQQLLYYSGSRLNLYYQLERCLPFTHTIRGELQLLLNEWYQDAGLALSRFMERLATDEARSFVETLQTLRMYESDAYYRLLKERLLDYKEKMELQKEVRKESFSYLLFVIAGIPMLYCFQVFIYPWVQEGRKLFDALN